MVEPTFRGYGKPTFHDVLMHYLFKIADATGQEDLEHMLITKLGLTLWPYVAEDSVWVRKWDAASHKIGTLAREDELYTQIHCDLERYRLLCEAGVGKGIFERPELKWLEDSGGSSVEERGSA